MESFSSYHNGGQNREQDYQKLTQTIGSSIQKISQNVTSMQHMINQIGTHQDSSELRKQVHSIQHYTQQLAKDTNGYIKELNTAPPAPTQSEQRQRKMQRERLQDEFTSTLNVFQAVQRSAAQKEKEQVHKAKVKAFEDKFSGGFKRDQQLTELQAGSEGRQQQQQMQLQDEEHLRSLQEQEQSIRQLKRHKRREPDIFKELGATLVHEQGDIVDSIEANVERTEDYVSQGVHELREASTYLNKIRRKQNVCVRA